MNIHSIRAKITAITVAAILTTVVAIFVAGYSTVKVENERRATEVMNMITKDTAGSVDQYLKSVQQSVEAAERMAENSLDSVTLIKNGAAGDYIRPEKRSAAQNEALDAYLDDYCDDLQKSFGSFADRTYGVLSYYYCINPEISKNAKGFFYEKKGKTGFVRQKPVDTAALDPTDMSNCWYFTAVQKGRPSWIGPYVFDKQKKTWLCTYAMPVYKAGMLIGVMGMNVPADIIVSSLRDIRVYDTGYACLFSEDGRVIYHPKQETGSIPGENDRVLSEEELTHNIENGKELISYNINGTEYQMTYANLTSGMTLVVTAPEKEISASWNNLFHMLILITILFVLIFAMLAYFVMGLITHPLEDLTAASKRLAGGDYDVELDYNKNDELGVLTSAFTMMRDKLKQSIDDLNRRLYTDALTDLPNMRAFFNLAKIEKKRMLEQGREPVMLYIDLIGMKHYNVQFGFEEGDRLLCGIGRIIEEQFGRNRMCRYGDDHFAVITDAEGLDVELDLLLENCRYANNGNSLPVSIGIYTYILGDVSVSVACDRAKYACDTHRGVYESAYYRFDRVMLRQAENTRYIINHLDQAIRKRWIKVYYQPIVSASSGKICDEEALSRWIDPEIGFMSPEDFIPVLENSRLIYKLDLYVLDRIIEKIKKQEKEGIPVVPHSLNLSRSDFDSCDIVEEIRKRIDNAGIPREMLTIEVTESMIGSDFEFMKTQVERFRSLGFKVWMDDFGSGYSSLDVLQNIHFDLLKFDMSFLRRADEGSESRIILRELTVMARELGIETLCEGVETEEQAEFLRSIGCSKLQGYHYSKPVPYDAIVRMFRDGSGCGYEEFQPKN